MRRRQGTGTGAAVAQGDQVVVGVEEGGPLAQQL